MTAPAVIQGGAQLVGAGMDYLGARQANKANREMAREQMAFQERMSNTAYQRAMQDMRAAGINPILAYSQGGASSPGGAMATSQNEMSGAQGAIGRAVSSAIDMKRANAEIRNMEAQNHQIASQTGLNKALTETAFQDRAKRIQETRALSNQNVGTDIEAKIDSGKFGKIIRYVNRLNPLSWLTKLL